MTVKKEEDMNCRRSFLFSYFLFFLVQLLARRNYAAAPDPSKKTPCDIIVIRELCTFAPATELPFNISPSQRYHRRGLRRERQTSTRGWNSRSIFGIESVAVDGLEGRYALVAYRRRRASRSDSSRQRMSSSRTGGAVLVFEAERGDRKAWESYRDP